MDIKIRQMIMDAASAAIEVCCKNTSYGQYYVNWYDIEDVISEEDFFKYYHDIIEELWTREEILDVYETEDMELDINCGGNWCVNLEDCEANADMLHDYSDTLPVTWPKVEV